MSNPAFEALVQFMRETFDQDAVEIGRRTTASDVPGWNSLSHVMLMLEIGQAFGVALPADETAELEDVGALYDLIVERRAEQGLS